MQVIKKASPGRFKAIKYWVGNLYSPVPFKLIVGYMYWQE
jgi:hypothetical protein